MKRYLTYFCGSLCAVFLIICFSAFSKGKEAHILKSTEIHTLKNTINNSLANNYTIKTVVIDAGHGGHDGGCSGKHSKEKHITLKIAKQLKKYIQETFPDVHIILTRETDVFIPLHQRSAIANKNKADLFISVHCNAAPHSSTVKGTETYVMGLHKTESNLSVAKRENAVILEETDYANHYDGFDPNSPMAHITFSLFQHAYQEQSIAFADLIEKQFSKRAGRKSRGVKQAGFLVLYKTAMPSVLVESGFLTNQSEEDFLQSTYGQEIISSAIYRAFKEYKLLVEEKGSVAFIQEQAIEENQEMAQPEITASPPVWQPEPIKTTTEKPESSETKVAPKTTVQAPQAPQIPITSQGTIPKTPITETQEKELSFIEAYLNKHSNFMEEVSPKKTTTSAESSPVIKQKKHDSLLNEAALIYKVQIFLSSNDAILNSTNLNDIIALEIESIENGFKRYLSGRFSDYESAKTHCAQLKTNGFPDAFVVKYQLGERVY